MTQYSEVIRVVWLLAAAETHAAKHAYLEKEHLFLGICKAVSRSPSRLLQQLNLDAYMSSLLEAEIHPIAGAFTALRIDADFLGRKLRKLIGTGSHRYAEGETIHRSKGCKMLYERAEKILCDASAVLTVGYLLQAILENPESYIQLSLREAGTDEKSLLQAIRRDASLYAPSPAAAPAGLRKPVVTPMLDKFGIDLTALARERKLSPLIGRSYELTELVRVLLRLKKNNPVLIGEAGVGKTQIVHGLAVRMASGNINAESLRGKRLIEINPNSLVAGTTFRGKFEQRMEGIIREARMRPDVTLFFDEIHTLVGAGNARGALDAASTLKPWLAKGELRCIGATTIAEYRKHIEPDAALKRRFEPILVAEPSTDEAREILKGFSSRLEEGHGVSIQPSAIDAALHLGVRYMINLRLPDKAITVLEDACIRAKTPELSYCEDRKGPLVPEVTDLEVAAVVSEKTGIPIDRIRRSSKDRMLYVSDHLQEAIIGQEEAVAKISRCMRQAAAGLSDQNRPLGVFLFVGPSGVGKTQTSKALAGILFDSEENLIRLDMAEFSEKHTVSKLIGAPPGYVGYGEEGQLTGKLRTRPYSVVLLDEIEKAHPEVLNLFLALFDEGRISDARGCLVDGRSCVFVMTSNAGAAGVATPPAGFQNGSGKTADLKKDMLRAIQKSFALEFLNRTEVVFFKPLSLRDLAVIGRRMIAEAGKRFKDRGISLCVEEEALEWVCRQGYDKRFGARHLQRAINDLVLGPVTDMCLADEVPEGSSLTMVLRGEKSDFVVGEAMQACDADATRTL